MSRGKSNKLPIEERVKEQIGKRYGYLICESVVEINSTRVADCLFRFKCDCGGHVEYLNKRVSSWNALGKPHCKNCISTRDGLVRVGTKDIVFSEIHGKKEDLRDYSDKDPFANRRKCTAECNVCMLRQFNCCHDCNMFSDCTKCYKHCRENPDTCGYCIGGKRD